MASTWAAACTSDLAGSRSPPVRNDDNPLLIGDIAVWVSGRRGRDVAVVVVVASAGRGANRALSKVLGRRPASIRSADSGNTARSSGSLTM
ncbi:hypothetical protein, partial [Actinoplanes sp. NBRC 103695]|uniref:hypothetical protein n=1 Tax=Actinoplanes sp. NBRC 103695 TaxID=3032202 RepID=UPI0025562624